MSVPAQIGVGQCVFVQGVDENSQPACYGYKYPTQTGFPLGSDIDAANCEIVGVASNGALSGSPVEFVTEGLVARAPSVSDLVPGQPVYCDDNGQLSATPGTRTIQVGHAVSAVYAYIRVQNAD